MAVRIFEYQVAEDSIAASSIPQGGVQGEHNATQVIFKLSDDLSKTLSNLLGDDNTKKLCYRFDLYDGTGGKTSTDAINFVPNQEKTFSHLIEQWQTRYGGTIQIFFVITLINADETEMELYSYCVKIMLKSLPEAKEADAENYESVSTLAMITKSYSQRAVEAAQTASEAMKRTELAKAALEGGSEWVFDGGDAKGNIDLDGDGKPDLNAVEVKFVLDKEMSDISENAVMNKIIKAYVDKAVDYIVEQGIDGIWTYRKWKSGISECWCSYNLTLDITSNWANTHYYGIIGTQNFPDGLFIDRPKMILGVEEATGNTFTTKRIATKDNTGEMYCVSPNQLVGKYVYIDIEAKGRWKEE